jgi:hypothetical protein
MNVYEKLAKARVMFQANNPKMSGKNTYAGYTYFELSDILPVINKIGAEIGFVCEVSFSDVAELVFRNTEKPEESIRFVSPMSTATLKGCHEVQNLGAVQTYIKRYLYQNAFEIVESDALNAGTKEEKKPAQDKPAQDDIAEKEKAFIAEFEDLQKKLNEYLNKKGIFEHPENVRAVIAAKDVKNMRLALSHAKACEKILAERAKKPAPAIPENIF